MFCGQGLRKNATRAGMVHNSKRQSISLPCLSRIPAIKPLVESDLLRFVTMFRAVHHQKLSGLQVHFTLLVTVVKKPFLYETVSSKQRMACSRVLLLYRDSWFAFSVSMPCKPTVSVRTVSKQQSNLY